MTNFAARIQKNNIEFLIMSFPENLYISTPKSAKMQLLNFRMCFVVVNFRLLFIMLQSSTKKNWDTSTKRFFPFSPFFPLFPNVVYRSQVIQSFTPTLGEREGS